jgi:hypothetical protein
MPLPRSLQWAEVALLRHGFAGSPLELLLQEVIILDKVTLDLHHHRRVFMTHQDRDGKRVNATEQCVRAHLSFGPMMPANDCRRYR